MSAPLDPEDEKLVTLARASRARTGAAGAAAVRDSTGRTYSAVAVEMKALRLSALQAAIAVAVGSGTEALEAAAVISSATEIDPDSLAAMAEIGTSDCSVMLVGPDGTLTVVRP